MVWTKIKTIMDSSLFFRAVDAILNCIAAFFSESIIFKWLLNENDGESRIFSAINRFLTKLLENIRVKLPLAKQKQLPAVIPEAAIIFIAASAPFVPTMILAGFVLIAAALFVFKLLTDKRYSLSFDAVSAALTIYIFISLFSGAVSFTPRSSLQIALLTSLFMAVYFLVLNVINNRKKFEIMIFISTSAAVVAGLYGLYQQFSGVIDKTWVDQDLFQDIQIRIYSTFANPNVYGTYLLLAAPLSMVMVLYSKNRILKLFYAGASSILLLNLALSYSRGCYLAFAVGLVVFILLTEKRLVTLLSAGFFMIPLIIPANMLNRLYSIANMQDSSTSYRIMIWQATVRMINNFWFTGLGQGIEAFNVVYPFYGFSMVTAPHSHNLFLQILVETGIWGLLAFLGVIGYFYRTQIKLLKTKDKLLAAMFISAVTAFLLQGMFDYVFYNHRVLLIFFLMLGMGCALKNISKKEESVD